MAINKKKTSPALKALIIAVAVMLVLAFMLPLVSPNLFSGGSDADAIGESGQLEAIAGQFTGTIDAYQQQLASDPASYTVLVNMGNTYSDWANDIIVYQGGAGAADQPVWIASTVYYGRALAVDATDPAVRTDLAIAYFYSGDLDMAIATIEDVKVTDPDFAPAFYNSMIFYDSVGMTAEAVTAATRYLELDPQGASGNPEYAQEVLDLAGANTAP